MPRKLTIDEFILRSKSIHNNKFDYSQSIYVNNNTKIKIICPMHGEFYQRPGNHLFGLGCHNCGGTKKLTKF